MNRLRGGDGGEKKTASESKPHEAWESEKVAMEPIDIPLKPPFHPLVINLSTSCQQDVIILVYSEIGKERITPGFSPDLASLAELSISKGYNM